MLRCRGFLRSLGGACYDSTWIIQDGWESNFQRNFDVSPFLGQKFENNLPYYTFYAVQDLQIYFICTCGGIWCRLLDKNYRRGAVYITRTQLQREILHL